jgi:hypothetical protein
MYVQTTKGFRMRKIGGGFVLPDQLLAFLPAVPPDFRAFFFGDELASLLPK